MVPAEGAVNVVVMEPRVYALPERETYLRWAEIENQNLLAPGRIDVPSVREHTAAIRRIIAPGTQIFVAFRHPLVEVQAAEITASVEARWRGMTFWQRFAFLWKGVGKWKTRSR